MYHLADHELMKENQQLSNERDQKDSEGLSAV